MVVVVVVDGYQGGRGGGGRGRDARAIAARQATRRTRPETESKNAPKTSLGKRVTQRNGTAPVFWPNPTTIYQ